MLTCLLVCVACIYSDSLLIFGVLLPAERGARLPGAVADDGGGVRAPAGERRGPHHQTTH